MFETTFISQRKLWTRLLAPLLASLLVESVWAVELAPGLSLTAPENLSIDVQSLEVVNGATVLVGYLKDEPAYFIAAQPVDQKGSSSKLWRALEASIARASDTGNFHQEAAGQAHTLQGVPLDYRLYRFSKMGVMQTQVFYLVKGPQARHWVYVTGSTGVDLQALLPLLTLIVRRAELAAT